MKKTQENDKRPSYRTAPFESSEASQQARDYLLDNFKFGWLFSADQLKSISPNSVAWLTVIGTPEIDELLKDEDGAWMHNLVEYIKTEEPVPKDEINDYVNNISGIIAERFDPEKLLHDSFKVLRNKNKQRQRTTSNSHKSKITPCN